MRTSSGFRIKLTYDEYNRASDVKFEFGSDALSTSWIYGKSSVVYGVKYNGTEKLSYNYDSLMRRSKNTINTTTPFVTTYGYKDISLDKTTTQLNSISYSNGKGFVYTYDANGNILTIKDQDNTLLANYTYDSLNQLTREDNAQLNKTITYTYDDGGNILSIKEYAFTTGELGSVTNEKTYTYGNTEWKDLLTNYNGTSITYDTIGNPLNWINGETFTWTGGRQLTNVTKGNNTISYTYNDDSIRTSKTVNGVRTDYYLNDTTVIMQKTGDNVIWYTYDENGLVTGFRYNGNEYYYIKNAQSDIIGIIDSSGTVVANYTYDSWGKHIAITDGNGNDVSADANHIANINPFRYRGYYYDIESGLYYLQSRYFDGNVGRFLNADGYTSTGQGSVGNNMFAYCGNNPINHMDLIGLFWKEVGDFFKNIWNGIKNFAKNTFGAGSSSTTTISEVVTPIISSPSPILVESGLVTTHTVDEHGDSSKPISVYAEGNIDEPILSTAGIKINIVDFTLDLKLGLDNISLSGSIKNDNVTDSFGLRANIYDFKIGAERATVVQWDSFANTSYVNASINGWTIVCIIASYCLKIPIKNPATQTA